MSTLTQRLLARTACFTACRKESTGRLGILIRSAPEINLMAFSSGRNKSMRSSSVLYAFKPSNNPCQHPTLESVITSKTNLLYTQIAVHEQYTLLKIAMLCQ